MSQLKAPFPWFGGKSKIAPLVWEHFGDVKHYIEPFFGTGAVLLGRPQEHKHSLSTVNDKDGFVANFWRAIKHDPDEVARYADWPVNEVDFHARHVHLVNLRAPLEALLRGDPHYYDSKVAGWWVWGVCLQIGGEFCSGKGAWTSVDGVFCKSENGVCSKESPHLGNAGRGVHKSMLHLGNAGQGIALWFDALSQRLRRTRVLSGDWMRVVKSRTVRHPGGRDKYGSITGIFLDPPYLTDSSGLYSGGDDASVTDWCLEHGADPRLRIALCGYEGEYDLPGWDIVAWKANGGYSNRNKANINASKERVWFSPHCLSLPEQSDLI